MLSPLNHWSRYAQNQPYRAQFPLHWAALLTFAVTSPRTLGWSSPGTVTFSTAPPSSIWLGATCLPRSPSSRR